MVGPPSKKRTSDPRGEITYVLSRSPQPWKFPSLAHSTQHKCGQHMSQEREGFRLPKSSLLTIRRGMAAELQQSSLVRMKRKRELLKPHTHCFPEAPCVGCVLKAHNNAIREPQDNDVATSFIASPPLDPDIEGVV